MPFCVSGSAVDELDLAWDLALGERLPEVLANLGDEPVRAFDVGAKDDERANELPASLEVAAADDTCIQDRLMPEELLLDLGRAEPVPAARDHVLGSAEQVNVPVPVSPGDVAGDVEVASEDRLRLVGSLPVAREERGRAAPHGEVSLLAGWKLVPTCVDDQDVAAGKRKADRAGTRRCVGSVADDRSALDLAVPVVNRDAPGVLERRNHVGAQRVARRDHAPEPEWDVAPENRVTRFGQCAVLRGRLAEDRDLEPADQIQSLLRVERTVVDDDLRASGPRAEQDVPDGQRRVGLGCAPDHVVHVGVEPVLGLHARGEGGSMRVRDAMRSVCSSGGRQDEGKVARRRVCGRLVPRQAGRRSSWTSST